MFTLKKHLASREKFIASFHPARRAYLFSYAFYSLFLVLSLLIWAQLRKDAGTGFFQTGVFTSAFSTFFSGCIIGVFLVCSFLLARLEWQIWSRRYGLTNFRAIYSRGIFFETFKSINYQYITDISFHQTFFDKILNTGTLVIDTASNESDIEYRKVAKPLYLKKIINDEQTRAIGKKHHGSAT